MGFLKKKSFAFYMKLTEVVCFSSEKISLLESLCFLYCHCFPLNDVTLSSLLGDLRWKESTEDYRVMEWLRLEGTLIIIYFQPF